MAAQNFSINFVDTGNNGSGPYTATLLQNPSSTASGGTTVTQPTQTANASAISLIELTTVQMHLMINVLSKLNQVDTNN